MLHIVMTYDKNMIIFAKEGENISHWIMND